MIDAVFRNRLAGDHLRTDRRLSDRKQEPLRISDHDGRESELDDGRIHDPEFGADNWKYSFFWIARSRLEKLAKTCREFEI